MSDQTEAEKYTPPVSQLLALGDVNGEYTIDKWRDYLTFGLTEEHIPDLIRMALDMELHWADSETPEIWSPIHAWRALGQLRAEATIEPLISLFHAFEKDGGSDWVSDDLPDVFGLIGCAAIPAMQAYLANKANLTFPRATAGTALSQIGRLNPECRMACITVLATQLERTHENPPDLNGFMIADLLDLKAVEALPSMEKAFAVDSVDLSIVGDLDDVQVALGLKESEPRVSPPRFEDTSMARFLAEKMGYRLDELYGESPFDSVSRSKSRSSADPKKKAKRKQAAQSRKQNRKKK